MRQFFVNNYSFKILLLTLVFPILTMQAQLPLFTTANLHSHNDYEQPVPFWNAYYSGFGSIEVDIFLHNQQLLVAHEENELNEKRTLQSLYLEPLNQVVRQIKNDKLILLIDIKTEAISTLDALIKVLNKYPALINSKRLQFVITGNQPVSQNFKSYPRYIMFDGKPDDSYDSEAVRRVALMSANFKKYSSWNGKGIITASEKKVINDLISRSQKNLGVKVRFWNAPDIPNAWYQLMSVGVGLINTDHVYASSSFFKQLPNNSFKALQKQLTYKPQYKVDGLKKSPKNIILLIADGMGLAHLHAGYTANYGDLATFKIKHSGLSLTASFDSYITDSAPGATAFSSGEKTNNRSVGVDHTGQALKTLPDYFYAIGKRSAIITSGDITDATPAAFYAHRTERTESLSILSDLKQSPVSILIGSGSHQIDSALVSNKTEWTILRQANTNMLSNKKTIVIDSLAGKPVSKGRGDWLASTFDQTIQSLLAHEDGFLLIAEGAQVDYGGHANQLSYVVSEVLDFDKLVSAALAFADKNEETLVIVTADHETGGLTLLDGNFSTGYVSGHFSTTDHTAVPVPVFAYGPMSQLFTGVFENTSIYKKIIEAILYK